MISLDELRNLVMGLLAQVGALEDAGVFVPARAPYTSTAWDGDTYSTTGPTLLDLSAVFGIPSNVKAVLARISCKDTGSAGGSGYYVYLSPTDAAATAPLVVRPSGLPNSYWAEGDGIVPCDGNGDVYVAIGASGAGTMTVHIQIWGWWL